MTPNSSESSTQSLQQRLRSLPLATRITGCLAIAALLFAALFASRPQSAPKQLPLFGDARLQTLELQRIRLALSQAGIIDTEIRDQQIWVARDRVPAALKAINEQNVMPTGLRAESPAAPSISPFTSRLQQQLQQQHQKKLALQSLIRRLTFVADVFLEIDFGDSTGSREMLPTRCTLTIQPVDGQYLETSQLETIRQIALGSLSQLLSENLVIVDLAAGLAFDDQLLEKPQTARQARLIEKLRYCQRLDREIRQRLSNIAGVEISVTCQDVPATEPGFAPGSVASAKQLKTKGLLPAGSASLPGTNGTASIDSIAAENKAFLASASLGESAESEAAKFEPQVLVRLPGANPTSDDANPESTLAASMEQEQFRKEVLERIRPLLPNDSFAQSSASPITVEFSSVANQSSSQTIAKLPVNQWLSSRTGGIWIAVGSTIGLSFLLLLSLRRREDACVKVAEPEVYATTDDAREQKLKQQIDELLRVNPDTAANVIREWIQKAA